MSLLFSSLGIIFGSIYFILGDHKIFTASLIILIASSVIFTALAHRRREIVSIFILFLLTFFNYNLRSEYLEYLDISQYINQNKSQSYFQIASPVKNKIFNSEFIVELKNQNRNLFNSTKEFFLPIRFLASSPSTLGLEEGDTIEISGNYNFEKLTDFEYKYHKKNKCFYKIKKAEFSFTESHQNIINQIQKQVKTFYYHHLDKENAAIVSSLILGAKIANPPEKFTSIAYKLGIGHFLAASGFQLVVLIFLINLLLKNCKVPLFINNSISIIAVLVYGALAGFSPSITRAAICTIAFLLLQLSKRKLESKRFITILAGIVLLIDPYTIYDLGFQFSYLATLAILLWSKTIENCLSFIKLNILKEAITVTLSVQLLLLPLSIYYFANLQIWSILSNIVLTPILTLITLLGFFGLYFLIDPVLNLTKFIIYSSEQLPFISARYSTDLTSVILFTIFINLLAIIICKPKFFDDDNENLLLSVSRRKYDENLLVFLKKISSDRYMKFSLLFSSLALLLAVNLNPLNTISVEIENGLIKNNQELIEIIKDKKINYKYLDYKGLKLLIIKKRNSLKTLGPLLNDLKEVDILILPKLSDSDIYLNTIIDLSKPQFVIASMNENSKAKKSLENLEIITSKTNTVIDSGVIYISKSKFWKLI